MHKKEEQKKDCVVLITKGCILSGEQNLRDEVSKLPEDVPFGISWQDKCFTGIDGGYMTTRKVAEETARRQNRSHGPDMEYTVYTPVEPTVDAADAKWGQPEGLGDKPLLQSSHSGIICTAREPKIEEQLRAAKQELDLLNYHVAHFRMGYGMVKGMTSLYSDLGDIGRHIGLATGVVKFTLRRFEQIKEAAIAEVES